ncbi:MAG: hypothetical protein ACXW2E_01545 [Nitrososphaeraceae archaeon]
MCHTSTNTIGKEVHESTWLMPKVNALTKNKRGWYIGLIGNPDRLQQHIDNAMLSAHCRQEQIIFVERDQSTYEAITKKAQIIRFRGQIIKGDFISILVSKLDEKYLFNQVDYDGTENYNKYASRLIEIYTQYKSQIQALCIVSSLRTRYNPYNTSYSTGIISDVDWRCRANQLQLDHTTYRGKHPMIQFLITDTPPIKTFRLADIPQINSPPYHHPIKSSDGIGIEVHLPIRIGNNEPKSMCFILDSIDEYNLLKNKGYFVVERQHNGRLRLKFKLDGLGRFTMHQMFRRKAPVRIHTDGKIDLRTIKLSKNEPPNMVTESSQEITVVVNNIKITGLGDDLCDIITSVISKSLC